MLGLPTYIQERRVQKAYQVRHSQRKCQSQRSPAQGDWFDHWRAQFKIQPHQEAYDHSVRSIQRWCFKRENFQFKSAFWLVNDKPADSLQDSPKAASFPRPLQIRLLKEKTDQEYWATYALPKDFEGRVVLTTGWKGSDSYVPNRRASGS